MSLKMAPDAASSAMKPSVAQQFVREMESDAQRGQAVQAPAEGAMAPAGSAKGPTPAEPPESAVFSGKASQAPGGCPLDTPGAGSPNETGLQTEVPAIQTEVSGVPIEEAPVDQAADVPESSAQPPRYALSPGDSW